MASDKEAEPAGSFVNGRVLGFPFPRGIYPAALLRTLVSQVWTGETNTTRSKTFYSAQCKPLVAKHNIVVLGAIVFAKAQH